MVGANYRHMNSGKGQGQQQGLRTTIGTLAAIRTQCVLLLLLGVDTSIRLAAETNVTVRIGACRCS